MALHSSFVQPNFCCSFTASNGLLVVKAQFRNLKHGREAFQSLLKVQSCQYNNHAERRKSNSDQDSLKEETGITMFSKNMISLNSLQPNTKLPHKPCNIGSVTDLDNGETPNQDFEVFGKKDAWGLVMKAVTGTGWVTGSGLSSPSNPEGSEVAEWPKLFNKSPRRRMGVEFTCNKCNTRTTRAINPHAFKEGTVFVQCKGCDVFHKLVDNLGLFHELKGSIFLGQAKKLPDAPYHQPCDPLGYDMDDLQSF